MKSAGIPRLLPRTWEVNDLAAMLTVEGLEVYYGSIHAIKNISFEVNEGEIVTLIGANGAGKTTTLHAVCGLVKAADGGIHFCGTDLRAIAPYKILGLGLAQVPEGRRVFAKMTVQENLEMGAYIRRDKDQVEKDFQRVLERLPRLAERRKQLAGTLSGGEQQMLAIGRALMGRPKILLLDEPSMGLAPLVVSELFEKIVEINKQGMTILLVEQNAKIALGTTHYTYVIEQGNIILDGLSKDLEDDIRIKQAYLGKFVEH